MIITYFSFKIRYQNLIEVNKMPNNKSFLFPSYKFLEKNKSSVICMMKGTGLLVGIVLLGLLEGIHGMKISVNDYASSIQFDEVMGHLNALNSIATETGGNRAIHTQGFNRTLDYITDYLAANTNLKVTRTFFNMRNFQLLRTPTLVSSINGVSKTHTYSSNLAVAEFYHAQYSTSAEITSELPLTAIPNVGCTDADWLAARPAPAGLVAIVKRGTCTFQEKALLAEKYNVAALLMYNDGSSQSNMQPILVNVGLNNRVPVLFLSYTLGNSLVTAVEDITKVVRIRLSIATDTSVNPVGNICADTLTGDASQTIIIGSHSDSVPAGPGINDNGKRND